MYRTILIINPFFQFRIELLHSFCFLSWNMEKTKPKKKKFKKTNCKRITKQCRKRVLVLTDPYYVAKNKQKKNRNNESNQIVYSFQASTRLLYAFPFVYSCAALNVSNKTIKISRTEMKNVFIKTIVK